MCLLLRYKIFNFAPIPKITCYLPNPKYLVYEHKFLGQKLVFLKDTYSLRMILQLKELFDHCVYLHI